ncbi:MAG TPA: hypothetical protein DD422_08555, partial [Akkermansia sp.]|nr:hypothetical protein [Akkermansia sp.]
MQRQNTRPPSRPASFVLHHGGPIQAFSLAIPGFLKAFSAQGEQARNENSSPANAVFPYLPIYIEQKTVVFYNAGQAPFSMPSNSHSYMVLAIVCVCAFAMCAFLSWQNREKKNRL